jgi:hypothetical protein
MAASLKLSSRTQKSNIFRLNGHGPQMTATLEAMEMLGFLNIPITGRHSTATATSLRRTTLDGSYTPGRERVPSTWLEMMEAMSFQIGSLRDARGTVYKASPGFDDILRLVRRRDVYNRCNYVYMTMMHILFQVDTTNSMGAYLYVI